MKSVSQIAAALRRKNIGQYGLLAGCCFFSVLLITAYVTMMCSPTVLTVLPEGGDSRKQVMMIFVLSVIGCGVFTTYASGLFFRYKSREMGIFLALGASKSVLRRILTQELGLIALVSCGIGALLGTPLAWALWKLFRVLIVDSLEMAFVFAPQAYWFALFFSLFVFIMLFGMMQRFLRRTNVLDVVNESRKSETVRLVPRRYGWLGILLIVVGGFLGYSMPSFFILEMQWYPPDWLSSIFYLPAFAGLYMVLLHTVVNGWRRGANRYSGLIATSMMQFQGRQTVRNMIVVALLVAGAFFASFYTPLLATSSAYSFDQRQTDYLFHYRSDQPLPSETEIRRMAQDMDVTITDYASVPASVLGVDGLGSVETDGPMGTTYEVVYQELLYASYVLPESAYTALTGDTVDLLPGEITTVFSDDGLNEGMTSNDVRLVTNPISGAVLSVTPVAETRRNNMLLGWRILDDSDYARITAGLPNEWKNVAVAFNVENVEQTYPFAKALFHEIVNRSGKEVAMLDFWDPIEKLQAERAGEPYAYDEHRVDYSLRDASEFRLYWEYMPQFRILDKNEFVKTTAVFLMLFVFIALLCFAAVGVILFTRSLTIAMTNRQVYIDLGKLGASQQYLRKTVREQISRLFFAPICTGTLLISMFYAIILYFNDGRFSAAELLSAGNCLAIVVGVCAVLYGLYRLTLKRIWQALELSHTKK